MKDQRQEAYKSEFVRCGRPTGRPLHIKELSFPGVSFVWNESSFYVPVPAPRFLCSFVLLCSTVLLFYFVVKSLCFATCVLRSG